MYVLFLFSSRYLINLRASCVFLANQSSLVITKVSPACISFNSFFGSFKLGIQLNVLKFFIDKFPYYDVFLMY